MASIAYLVKNFTSPIAILTPVPAPSAPVNASMPPLIPRYEIHASAPPPNTPSGARTFPRATAQAAAAITAHAISASRSTRRRVGWDSGTTLRRGPLSSLCKRPRQRPVHVEHAGHETEHGKQPVQPRRRPEPPIEQATEPPAKRDRHHELQHGRAQLPRRAHHVRVGLVETSHVRRKKTTFVPS